MDGSPRSLVTRRISIAGSSVLVGALVVGLASNSILESLGNLIVAHDSIQPAELVIITPESGKSGELEAADLFRSKVVARVAILVPTPTLADREFERRGVQLNCGPIQRLIQLGVPRLSILTIPAGEGGTTESSDAISSWFRNRLANRILVVVSPTHGTRFRRALRRTWASSNPLPAVCIARFDSFRPNDWWRSRTTLREGIVELEKLTLDYIRHPF